MWGTLCMRLSVQRMLSNWTPSRDGRLCLLVCAHGTSSHFVISQYTVIMHSYIPSVHSAKAPSLSHSVIHVLAGRFIASLEIRASTKWNAQLPRKDQLIISPLRRRVATRL